MTPDEEASATLMGNGLDIAERYLEKALAAGESPNLASAIKAVILHIKAERDESEREIFNREIGNY